MDAKQLEKLTRVLQLSTTDNDHEALVCIRRANAMLKERGLLWEQVVATPTPVKERMRQSTSEAWSGAGPTYSAADVRATEDFARQAAAEAEARERAAGYWQARRTGYTPDPQVVYERPSDEAIRQMFDAVLAVLQGQRSRGFILSLEDQFERTGRLSDKQLRALEKFYANAI